MVGPKLSRLAQRAVGRIRPRRTWRTGAINVPVPDGWVTGPPDVVGVGVQKAGTSWWWAGLLEHPRLNHSSVVRKELHFFDRFCCEPFGDRDVADYHSVFARPPGELAGEWTPRYMLDFWTPPLLRRAAPDAKLLVLLRDPVERYRSGLAHDADNGRAIDTGRAAASFERGLYGAQLVRLFRTFPRQQVLVHQFERCRAEPERHLRSALEFLGLERDAHPGVVDSPRNVSRTEVQVPDDIRAMLRRAYEDDVRLLLDTVDDIDVRVWPNFADLAP